MKTRQTSFGSSLTSRRHFLRTAGIAGVALLGAACGGPNGGNGASSDTRLVKHALGETRIPARPRRVVALDSFVALPVLLDAGVPVVGGEAWLFANARAADRVLDDLERHLLGKETA